ncbi:hypothetical protein [Nannocystis sp.]|uniref:hypothetical protein n=1 Tax=Nannocystis sp. TaxID=1962667 RepID=UPI0025D0DE2E|nr:hypothetical protein [Nannocystis sp.]MBK7825022.1 hypothetical protein [Nannocystis sp.]
MAVGAKVAVDVRLPDGAPLPGQELFLRVSRRGASDGLSLPTTTPIPLSYTDTIDPWLSRKKASECQIDDGGFASTNLDRLLGGAGLSQDERFGFHRLRCRSGGEPQILVSAYVQIVPAGVVFASSDAGFIAQQRRDLGRTSECATPAECLGLRLERTHSAALAVSTVVPEADAPEAASMLVLDRPRTARSCYLAKQLLGRGATVVVANPEGDFFSEECKQWFPVAPQPDAEGWIFDRTPRLTFAFDSEFEAGLTRAPSAVLGRDTPCKVEQSFMQSLLEQQRRADALCDAARLQAPDIVCAALGPANLRGAVEERFPDAAAQEDGRSSCPFTSDRTRLDCSAPSHPISRFAQELAGRREAWENELLVVFTHDQRDYSGRPAVLRSLASRTQIVEIDDPYGASLSQVYSEPAGFDLPDAPELVVLDEPRQSTDIHGPEYVRCDARSVPSLAGIDVRPLFSTEAQTKAEFTRALGAMTRFPCGGDPGVTPAPVRFGWWARPGKARGTRIEDTTVELAVTTRTAGIVERPLAIGAMVGSGHLLFLSYSPFAEKAHNHDTVLDGVRMIEDIHAATEEFIGEVYGEIVSVTPRPDGALWISVARDANTATLRDLDGLKVLLPGLGEFVAPLVDLAHDRGIFTYAFPAAELERLDQCVPFRLPVAEREGHRPMPIHVCPPDKQIEEGGRMLAIAALEQLAHFTGGRIIYPGEPDGPGSPGVLHTRPFGLGLLAVSFLLAWGRRAVRRLAGARAARQLGQINRAAQRRYDPPDAVVAAAGDWDGRATTWPRTGAFGGYRPIEPGDRAAAVLLGDLLVGRMNGTAILPRVALRIEEAAPAVIVLVNLGASMRTGGNGGLSKAQFAGRVALHVAASAWKIGGEAAIFAAGVGGEAELVAPSRLGPGHEEVAQALRERLAQASINVTAPWPADLPECGALVYVSDFQHEDEQALHVWLTDSRAPVSALGRS